MRALPETERGVLRLLAMHATDPGPAGHARDPEATAFLVQRARDGASEEMQALYERTLPSLYVWLRGRVHGTLRLQLDVEDLLQEIWSRALARFTTFDAERASFRAWLIGIAKLVMLEWMRRSTDRTGAAAHADPSAVLARCPDSITSVSRALERDESVRALIAYAAELDEDDRTLFFGHGIEEVALAQLATRLGISDAAAQKRWQRLVDRLRERGIDHGLVAPN